MKRVTKSRVNAIQNAGTMISELMEFFIESPEVNKLIHRFKDVETLKSTGNIYFESTNKQQN